MYLRSKLIKNEKIYHQGDSTGCAIPEHGRNKGGLTQISYTSFRRNPAGIIQGFFKSQG